MTKIKNPIKDAATKRKEPPHSKTKKKKDERKLNKNIVNQRISLKSSRKIESSLESIDHQTKPSLPFNSDKQSPPLIPSSSVTPRLVAAEVLAAKQREISVSEFFLKNRHLLGFDNPKKALLTTVKEAVDNSLDACEEAKILPVIHIEIKPVQEDRFVVIVEDNGPGVVREQTPKIFGKLLYGSKFHTMKQSRGQQGIGISAAGMYGQLTTGAPTKITSRISPKKPAHYFEILIDTNKNAPVIVKDEIVEWKKSHGTRVEIELEAKYQKAHPSIEDYIHQTAIANPHLELTYTDPDGNKTEYHASIKKLPIEPKAIKPHPHGVELGILMKMLKQTKSRRIKAFLCKEFSRVSPHIASKILQTAGISEKAFPSAIAHREADNLYRAINATKLMNPSTNCLSPIGAENILKGLKNNIQADFYTAVTRSPAVYRGNPFQIEAALAYGGSLPIDDLVQIMRFANRAPLLYQQSACAITKSIIQTAWKNYGLEQAKGALPQGPALLVVHMVSVWVPFTSESKEAIASYEEIIHEIKLALQECGRRLEAFIRKGRREAEAKRRKDYIRSYLPHIAVGLKEILKLKPREEKQTLEHLTAILEKSRTSI